MKPIIPRKVAIEEGLEKYFSGRPCKRGHLSERRTLTAACIECVTTKSAYIRQRQKERQQRLAEAEAARREAVAA